MSDELQELRRRVGRLERVVFPDKRPAKITASPNAKAVQMDSSGTIPLDVYLFSELIAYHDPYPEEHE